MSDVDNFLAHYGVKGMRWGRRKAPDASTEVAKKEPRKKMDPAKKALIAEVVKSAAYIGAAVAIRKGARWAVRNPDKIAVFMQRAQNTMNGTKAIGVGYEVIKIASG
jgi:hypothetical protein